MWVMAIFKNSGFIALIAIGQYHWPCAVVAHPLIEGIHSIGAQAKPYIPWVIAEFFVLLIDPLPLTTISRVFNFIIIHLALIIHLARVWLL